MDGEVYSGGVYHSAELTQDIIDTYHTYCFETL